MSIKIDLLHFHGIHFTRSQNPLAEGERAVQLIETENNGICGDTIDIELVIGGEIEPLSAS